MSRLGLSQRLRLPESLQLGAVLGGATPSWFPLNRKVGFIGDSITNGSTTTNAIYAFPRQSLQFAGTLHFPLSQIIIKGTPGNTSAQMLARFETDMTGATDIVIEAGTNDSADANAVAVGDASTSGTFAYNIVQMLLLAVGRPVVVVTPPPRGSTQSAAEKQRLIDYRTWILANAETYGYRVADAYNSLDNGTGVLGAAYNSGDDIHPNNLGHQLIASLVGPQLLAGVPARTSMAEALLANSLITNGLMAGTLGAGGPNSWIGGTPASTGTAVTRSTVVAPAFFQAGQGLKFDLDALANSSFRWRPPAITTGFSTGDKLLFIGKAVVDPISGDWDALSAAATASATPVLINGSTGTALVTSPAACPARERQMAFSYTVASGVTTILFQAQLVLPSGNHVQATYGEFGAYNLTQLGLADWILV